LRTAETLLLGTLHRRALVHSYMRQPKLRAISCSLVVGLASPDFIERPCRPGQPVRSLSRRTGALAIGVRNWTGLTSCMPSRIPPRRSLQHPAAQGNTPAPQRWLVWGAASPGAGGVGPGGRGGWPGRPGRWRAARSAGCMTTAGPDLHGGLRHLADGLAPSTPPARGASRSPLNAGVLPHERHERLAAPRRRVPANRRM
jgi:hypothetical protein